VKPAGSMVEFPSADRQIKELVAKAISAKTVYMDVRDQAGLVKEK
jgi:hypothetical protein